MIEVQTGSPDCQPTLTVPGEVIVRTVKQMAEAMIFASEETNRLLGGSLTNDSMTNDMATVARAMLKSQEFKDYVHKRLDAAGIPADPDSPHRAEGCRIGGRLDVLFAQRDALRAACEEVAKFRDCEDAADWKDAWNRLTAMCERAAQSAK